MGGFFHRRLDLHARVSTQTEEESARRPRSNVRSDLPSLAAAWLAAEKADRVAFQLKPL